MQSTALYYLTRLWGSFHAVVHWREFLSSGMKRFPAQPEKWKCNIARPALLTDVFEKLNELNISLQGRGRWVFELQTSIRAFANKLTIFVTRAKTGDFGLFPHYKEFLATKGVISKCKGRPRSILDESASKFQKNASMNWKRCRIYMFSFHFELMLRLVVTWLQRWQSCRQIKTKKFNLKIPV